MAGNKTRDGIRLGNVVKLAGEFEMKVRPGKGGHKYILNAPGMRACPVADSTDAKRMIVPWMRQATGYDNRHYTPR